MRYLLMLCFAGFVLPVVAQHNIFIQTLDKESRQGVMATFQILPGNKILTTDSTGILLVDFSKSGNYKLSITAVGFKDHTIDLKIPCDSDSLVVELISEAEEIENIIVHSTRTSRTIANVPTRVETIDLEEIDEKSNMRPANVAMILHESTGIQVQQTSATSGNASIRMQGLDGRYTQLLKDGYPNFGSFSSGLSLLEIPPLDLKQVEIIKGPASTLYGGGAIAGVVNFISKTPGDKPELNMIINQSNIGQSNIGAFYSGKRKKAGLSILALYNRSKAYDVDGDEFSEIPESDELTIHPKIFFYPGANTIISIGNSFTKANRKGGDMYVIRKEADSAHQYVEKNLTTRNVATLEWKTTIRKGQNISFKQSYSYFNRRIEIPGYVFAGREQFFYSDVSYTRSRDGADIVGGVNFASNSFREEKSFAAVGNNRMSTVGVYGQYTKDISSKLKLESGLRLEGMRYNNDVLDLKETFMLPRISLLVKYNSFLSSRIGGGLGYKAPTLFTEQTETMLYQDLLPLVDVKSERSYGATADFNFRKSLSAFWQLSFNHMFFYTAIRRPLVLVDDQTQQNSRFVNMNRPVESYGFESNLKIIYRNYFKLFLGYTFNDASAKYLVPNSRLRLVPRHKLNSAIIYEKEGKLKLGLEGYFTGKQWLSNGTQSPAFAEYGFMAEKVFRKFSVYINFENFTDTRQSRYKPVVGGSHLRPGFDEIWTHTEGFVYNGGLKFRL